MFKKKTKLFVKAKFYSCYCHLNHMNICEVILKSVGFSSSFLILIMEIKVYLRRLMIF